MTPCPPTTRPHASRARGFTITELIVVVSILFLLIGLIFPFMGALTGSTQLDSGLNIAGMSADVARQWVEPNRWVNDNISSATSPQYEQYNGTAALFCPTGEIRIVKNIRSGRDGTTILEDVGGGGPLAPNAYADLSNLDYITLPDNIGVVGIYKSGATVQFITPPFAIAFNENGNLNFGDTRGLIYYDSNSDASFDRSDNRGGSYDFNDWDRDNAPVISKDNPRKRLPFDAIECVAGIVVYNIKDYNTAEVSFGGVGDKLGSGGKATITSTAGQWLQENGRALFFSPQTGIALHDERDD